MTDEWTMSALDNLGMHVGRQRSERFHGAALRLEGYRVVFTAQEVMQRDLRNFLSLVWKRIAVDGIRLRLQTPDGFESFVMLEIIVQGVDRARTVEV